MRVSVIVAVVYATAIVFGCMFIGKGLRDAAVAPLEFKWAVFQMQKAEARRAIEENMRAEIVVPQPGARV